MKTRIIALEGIDGSGKTVQAAALAAYLEGRGYSVAVRSFPAYDGFFGRHIGALLKGDSLRADQIDSKSMCLWFALDRMADFKDFTDGESEYLIINRYVLSNAVYQSVREGDPREELWPWVQALEHGQLSLPRPDLYLIYDVAPGAAEENVLQKGYREYVGDGQDAYERQDGIQHRARARYLAIAGREANMAVVDCMQDDRLLAPGAILERSVQRLAVHGLLE